MFIHRHKYNVDSTLEIAGEIAQHLNDAIEKLAKEVKELRQEVDYLVDFLDD